MEPFIGEIRAFGFKYAPKDWAACNGQLLAISQLTALFSIIGTSYGGNGTTNFGLPNLTDCRVPIGAGNGPGLSPRVIGEMGGAPGVTLTRDQAAHSHALNATVEPGDVTTPTESTALARATGADAYAPPDGTLTNLIETAITPGQGGGAPHNNLMPFQTLNYCIALVGIFPNRG